MLVFVCSFASNTTLNHKTPENITKISDLRKLEVYITTYVRIPDRSVRYRLTYVNIIPTTYMTVVLLLCN